MSEPVAGHDQRNSPVVASNPYLEKLAGHLQEEREHRFPYFTAAVAFDLGLALRAKHIAWSASRGPRNPVVVSISTFSGAVLFQCIAGGDPPDAADLTVWAVAKANTVRRFGHSSAFVYCRMLATGKSTAETGLHWPEYAVVGGAFPIYLKNAPAAPLGAIAVAGLSHNDDHQLIVETLAEFIPSLSPPQARQQQSAPTSATLTGAQTSFAQSPKRREQGQSSARSSARPILASPVQGWSENEDAADESEESEGSHSSAAEEQEDEGRAGRAPWR